MTTSRHAFRFSRFSSGPWSLALSGCFSLVWSPAAAHWWWWSWGGTSQQGQTDRYHLISWASISVVAGFCWLVEMQGTHRVWPDRHKRSLVFQRWFWGFSFLGGVTEGWGSKNSGFFQGVDPILRLLSLFTAEGCFLLLAGTGTGILLPFSKEMEKFRLILDLLLLFWARHYTPCMHAEDG